MVLTKMTTKQSFDIDLFENMANNMFSCLD